MAIRIQYQNNVTGAAFDITTLVSGAKWSTKRSGSPASLELTVIVNDEIQWSHGGIVTLLDDKTGLFYGYVVKISQNEKEQVQITAYDQTWYLKKNKDTYVFKGKRADQVLKQIAEDFKLKTGSLANTGYSIPSMIEDGQTLFDIVLKAIDYTLINTGKMFVLWDNFGKLTLTDVETAKLDLFAFRVHAFAFVLWTFTVAAGAIWAEYAWGRYWGWDPKETWALVTWVVYAAYLHARATAGWKGTPAAWLAIIGVITFWFNFIGINLLVSGLHSYAGI